MVHGIGTHQPGYSTRLAENLARELNLDVVERKEKVVTLRIHLPKEYSEQNAHKGITRGKPGDKIGTLVIRAYGSKTNERNMFFHELTWSEITDADKKIIAYDNSGEYSFRRAEINNQIKQFINSHLPDPLIYLGDAKLDIQLAVTQTLCWMLTHDYSQIPEHTDQVCDIRKYPPSEVGRDDFVFISHSLGSRILTDAIQTITTSIGNEQSSNEPSENTTAWLNALRDETLNIFMLSNQRNSSP